MARQRSTPTKRMYVLPTEHSASPNEQAFSLAVPPEDGRMTMLATPGVPFDAASLNLSDEDFVEMVEVNNLPFQVIEVEDLEEMKLEDLRALAKERGVEVSGQKKADFISALSKPVDVAEAEDALAEVGKEDLVGRAEELGLDPKGLTKAELVTAIAETEAADG